MTQITLKGNAINTIGNLPEVGTKAPDFTLVAADLSTKTMADYQGQIIIMNIFPSLDTGTCAASVRRFNTEASKLENTVVLCISKDLPFSQARFCGAEGLEDVHTLSDFRDGKFGKDYGVEIIDGPLAALESRAVIIIDENGKVIYNQQVPEITEEPDYEAVMDAL